MIHTKVISLDDDTVRQLASFLNRYFNLEMGVFKESALKGEPLYDKALAEGLVTVIDEYARLTDKGRGLVNIRAVPRSYTDAEKAREAQAASERRAREASLPAHPFYQFLVAHCNPMEGSCAMGRVVGKPEFERCLHEGLLKVANERVMLTDKGMDVVLDRDGFMKVFHDAFDGTINESLVRRHDYYATAKVKKLVVAEKTSEGVLVRLTEDGHQLMDELFYFDRRKNPSHEP